MSEPRTKLCYVELMDKFAQAANEWLKEIPEARGLALVVDWYVGKDEFPPCMIVSKEINEQQTIAMMRQSTRFMQNLTNSFREIVDQADSAIAKLIKDQASKTDKS